VVRVEIDIVLHWRGGDHTALKVKKNTIGKHRWMVAEETETLVRELARLMPDRAIASVLNRAGKRTDRKNGWTQSRVPLRRARPSSSKTSKAAFAFCKSSFAPRRDVRF
jgi:hypothetical protein